MAYKELIGSFDEVRDYIREFFIYGIFLRKIFRMLCISAQGAYNARADAERSFPTLKI